MVYRAFHTNGESRLEKQPLVSRDRQVLAWDGRLDNRADLISTLIDELNGDHTDVAIVMAAYRKWPTDFLERLIADFALCLWDPRTRRLILARDPIGPRTLYYSRNGQTFIWATELGALLDIAGIKREVNDDYIADYLTRLPEPDQTPYKNIHAVPPAHAVIVSSDKITLQRFWGLNPTKQIRYQTDAEYEEQFRHLFRESVRCRLRAENVVWAELSGGLDSSSVVCMADDIIRSREATPSALQTISNVFDEAASSDERHYIQPVENRIGRRGCHVREDDFRILAPLKDGFQMNVPNPIANFSAYYLRMNELLSENGARVLLSGKGGDEILNSARDPSPELADLLIRGQLFSLHKRLKTWSRSLNSSYINLFYQSALMPLLPRNIQGRNKHRRHPEFFELYDQEFVRKMDFRMRRLGPADIFGHVRPSGQERAKSFLRVVRNIAAGYWREFGNVEISYPFTHRPLVEFLHAIPFQQQMRLGETRSLLRRAMRQMLPREIANRRGKRLNTEAALRALAREWPRLNRIFADPKVCAHGYVDARALRSKLALAREGKDPAALAIVFLIPLEYWLTTQIEV